MKFFNKKNSKPMVFRDFYSGNNISDLLDRFDNNESSLTSPSYLAGLQLLSNELARFKFIIKSKKNQNFLENAKVVGQAVNGMYEVLRYIYTQLLDTGAVCLVVYNTLVIVGADAFKILRNSAGDIVGIDINGVKVSKERCIIINLNDAKNGGFRDWLKDIVQLENNLLSFMKIYSRSFGLFGAYKVNLENIDDKTFGIIQAMLADARRKLQQGAIPVLPNSIDTVNKEMGWQAIEVIQDYIVKTIARVMGIPLLVLQAREQGSYALAKEERSMWYETSLQGYVELVRCAIEKWLRENVDASASVDVDVSGIDYINKEKEWNANEIALLLSAGIINTEEARKLLKIANDLQKDFKIQRRKQKEANIGGSSSPMFEEDANIHAWHAETIQPLEKRAADALEKVYSKVIEEYVKEKAKTTTTTTKKGQEKNIFDVRQLKAEELSEILNGAILDWLLRFYKITTKKALSMLKVINTEVFISPEDLYQGLEQMAKISQKWIGQTVAEAIKNTITNLTQNGKGYTWEEVVNAIKDGLKINQDAITVARTEINRACAYAHAKNAEEMKKVADANNWKIVKRWSTSMDDKVRPSHNLAGLEGWIDYDKPFANGLQRPYAEGASAKETVNCRCVLLTKIVQKEGLDANS